MLNKILELLELDGGFVDSSEIKLLLKKFLIDNSNDLETNRHPLGFYVVKLGSIGKELAVRLHIWNGQLEPQDKNLMIHNHIFDMKSVIILGQLTNIEYRLSLIGNHNCYLFNVEYGDGKSILTCLNQSARLEKLKEETFEYGNTYYLKKGIFHETKVNSEFYTSTLVVTKTASDLKPIVASKYNYSEKIVFEREKIAEELSNKILSDLIERI